MGQKRRRYWSFAHCKQSRDITKIQRMTTPKSNACQIILGFYKICKANHHVVNNEFGPHVSALLPVYFTTSLIFILYILSLSSLQVSLKVLTRAIMRSDLF